MSEARGFCNSLSVPFVPDNVGGINEHFAERRPGAGLEVGFNQAVLSWRTVGRDLMITQDLLDAERVKAVADRNHPRKLLQLQKLDALSKAVSRGQSAGFGENTIAWNILFLEIRFANTSFRKASVMSVTTSGQYSTGEILSEQCGGVIQPGTKHG